jgi:hypothetical protein
MKKNLKNIKFFQLLKKFNFLLLFIYKWRDNDFSKEEAISLIKGISELKNLKKLNLTI